MEKTVIPILSIVLSCRGEYIESGYYVSFKPFSNEKSDYNARNVIVIEALERKRKHGKVHK